MQENNTENKFGLTRRLSLEVAIAGKEYCEEIVKLLKDNHEGLQVSMYDIVKGEFPVVRNDVYIITDRVCEGESLNTDVCINALSNLMDNIGQDDIAIINVDDEDLIRHLDGLKCNIVTYGYNSKSSVTISGMDEDIFSGCSRYICSLQRNINTVDMKNIEPCEVKLSVSDNCKPHTIMAYAAFLLCSGNFESCN